MREGRGQGRGPLGSWNLDAVVASLLHSTGNNGNDNDDNNDNSNYDNFYFYSATVRTNCSLRVLYKMTDIIQNICANTHSSTHMHTEACIHIQK